jgi:hypothetical protein
MIAIGVFHDAGEINTVVRDFVWLCRGTCAMIQLAMLATVELMTENILDIFGGEMVGGYHVREGS